MKNLKAVIFDLDGTIVDVPYNWPQIKEELGTEGVSILSYLAELKEPKRSKKWKILEKYEKEATKRAVLKKGIPQLLDFLTKKSIKKALVTNNSQKNVSIILEKFNLEFDCIICRESGLWKPSGAPFISALKKLGVEREMCCVVGDSHFDIRAAEEAGIDKVFILIRKKEKYSSHSAELVESVEMLKEKIEELITSEK